MSVKFGFSLQRRGLLADRESITTPARRADALGYDSVWVTAAALHTATNRDRRENFFRRILPATVLADPTEFGVFGGCENARVISKRS
jgi:hypothetical protein